jgi:hypothetical protein
MESRARLLRGDGYVNGIELMLVLAVSYCIALLPVDVDAFEGKGGASS